MILKVLGVLRVFMPLAAIAVGIRAAFLPGNSSWIYESAGVLRQILEDPVIVLLFWCLIAALLWFVIGQVLAASSRRRPAKTGFDFSTREIFAAATSAKLPSGESLVNFVPVYEMSFVEGALRPSRSVDLHFYGLVLSTVGLRWVSFASPAEGSGRRDVRRLRNVVVGETVVRMSDIVQVQSAAGICPRIDVALIAFAVDFASPLPAVTIRDSLRVSGLAVTTRDGQTRTVWSPFREMVTLTKNLNSMRSGDFLSERAAGATDALDRLVHLLEDGTLTAQEFDSLKAGFVGSSAVHQESIESRLRQLHHLQRDGVLTESEFRQKKWDLLSKD